MGTPKKAFGEGAVHPGSKCQKGRSISPQPSRQEGPFLQGRVPLFMATLENFKSKMRFPEMGFLNSSYGCAINMERRRTLNHV